MFQTSLVYDLKGFLRNKGVLCFFLPRACCVWGSLPIKLRGVFVCRFPEVPQKGSKVQRVQIKIQRWQIEVPYLL